MVSVTEVTDVVKLVQQNSAPGPVTIGTTNHDKQRDTAMWYFRSSQLNFADGSTHNFHKISDGSSNTIWGGWGG